MGFLEHSTSGIIESPYYIFAWGAPGIGKSSFAAGFPKPYFLDLEGGTLQLSVSRATQLKTFQDVRDILKELLNSDYQTIVIDTIDALEPLIFHAVCALDGSASIDKAQGGYGKGIVKSLDYVRELLEDCEKLKDKGKHVVFLGHSQIKTFNDPTTVASYNIFAPKLNDKLSALFIERVDAVFYMTHEISMKAEKDQKKNRAFGDGKRVMHTEFRTGFVAKNRYGLPATMGLSFSEFDSAAKKGEPESLESIQSYIQNLLPLVNDLNTRQRAETATKNAGSDIKKLSAILNQLRIVANS